MARLHIPRHRLSRAANSISSVSSFSSPSPCPSPPPDSIDTIHHRRTLSRSAHASSQQVPPSIAAFILPVSLFHRTSIAGEKKESDAETWERMLKLQKMYHCYNSARLEAAVEALECGWSFESVPIPSRFCMDLLNEELNASIAAGRDVRTWS